jgi:adenosine kinase
MKNVQLKHTGKALICGSIAYDTIMVFPDRFKNHILPEKIHVLNVAFLVPELRRQFGGCAGNIAYNLKLLGDPGYPMATVGHDFGPYAQWLAVAGVPTDHVRVVDTEFTAQAFITTDLDDNQITAFHPGAMNHAHANRVGDVSDIALGIVAPDGREGMRSHVQQMSAAGIPFIFDPGQGLPMFSGDELIEMIDGSKYLAVNDYEGRLLCERTGLTLPDIAARVDALIVTLGGDGSRIYADGFVLDVPSVVPEALVDPTGCGDAYRAGLLYGIAHGWDWLRTGRLASLLGAVKIASRGGQNHVVDRDRLAALYAERFGGSLW